MLLLNVGFTCLLIQICVTKEKKIQENITVFIY